MNFFVLGNKRYPYKKVYFEVFLIYNTVLNTKSGETHLIAPALRARSM